MHYVLHAPQGDTYADLLFTMIERRGKRPPVTYTTFQARDLGTDTASIFQNAVRDAYERFQPKALLVGASCTAELIQDDPAGLAEALNLPCPVVPLELPSYQRKENWGASETFYRIVRQLVDKDIKPAAREGRRPSVNLLGPCALGFRHRDDVAEVCKLLGTLGIDVNCVAPLGAAPDDIRTLGRADFNIVLYPEIGTEAARWLEQVLGQASIRTVPIGVAATQEFIEEVSALAGVDPSSALADANSRLPWWSRSVDSTYLTGKRVFIFGDATHAIAAARIAHEELGFEICGLHLEMNRRLGELNGKRHRLGKRQRFLAGTCSTLQGGFVEGRQGLGRQTRLDQYPFDKRPIIVIAAQRGIAVGGEHFEHA
ncbi:MAG: hypothetical protein B7Y31_13865, partial [Novosphingobium sp. 16-62-11]